VNDLVQVGQTIAIIETAASGDTTSAQSVATVEVPKQEEIITEIEKPLQKEEKTTFEANSSGRFYSPLVKNIASTEGISQTELDNISGTGKEGRVTKNDILSYIENRGTQQQPIAQKSPE